VRPEYDVVVIGSGFGGAITAARLAEGGLSVAVLERGRRWRKEEFPRTIGEVAARGFWQEGRTQGLLEYRTFRRVDVIQGVGVGGGSLHYLNASLRAPAAIFRAPRWPEQLSREVLEPYYDVVQRMLEARPLAPSALPDRTRAFLEAARRAGREPSLVDVAVYTGRGRLHPIGGNPQLPASAAATACSAATATPRTRWTSRTSRSPSATAPRCFRCTPSTRSSRWSAATGSGSADRATARRPSARPARSSAGA
jgi:choline dehydrogenase-like flavoprotein